MLNQPNITLTNETINLGYNCVTLKNRDMYHKQNWRNRILHELLNKLDSNNSNIGISPFYHISAGRYDLHDYRVNDCTHFRFGHPLLWAPIWDYAVKFYMNFMKK